MDSCHCGHFERSGEDQTVGCHPVLRTMADTAFRFLPDLERLTVMHRAMGHWLVITPGFRMPPEVRRAIQEQFRARLVIDFSSEII